MLGAGAGPVASPGGQGSGHLDEQNLPEGLLRRPSCNSADPGPLGALARRLRCLREALELAEVTQAAGLSSAGPTSGLGGCSGRAEAWGSEVEEGSPGSTDSGLACLLTLSPIFQSP